MEDTSGKKKLEGSKFKRYYDKNREAILAKSKERYAKNREAMKELALARYYAKKAATTNPPGPAPESPGA
jgi:hypothetical protein